MVPAKKNSKNQVFQKKCDFDLKMIYFQINQIKNRKISKRFKSKSKSHKNDLNRDLNHARFKSPMILTALCEGQRKLSIAFFANSWFEFYKTKFWRVNGKYSS